MDADGLIRLEAEASEPLLKYEKGLRALLNPVGGSVETLSGVQRPRSYTSHAMTQYAYAPRPTAWPWKRPSPGCGDADEQECRMVGHGLDAPGKLSFCPGTTRRKTWVVKGHAAGGGRGHRLHNSTIGARSRRVRQGRML